MQPLDPFLLECGGHWLNGLEEVFQRLELVLVQHAGFERRLVGVVGEEVPTGEDQIFEIRQGHEVLDLGHALVGSFAEPDRPHLSEGPDRSRESASNSLDTRDHGSCHGAQTHRHNTQLTLGFINL